MLNNVIKLKNYLSSANHNSLLVCFKVAYVTAASGVTNVDDTPDNKEIMVM